MPFPDETFDLVVSNDVICCVETPGDSHALLEMGRVLRTGGNLLAKATFIQRLNTRGGAVPTTACTAGQTQLVPYTADYFFFRADQP